MNPLEDLLRFLPTLLRFKLKTLVKPAITLIKHFLPFQPGQKTLMIFNTEGKRINFISNNEEPYKTNFSVEEFHHALTTTNETSPGYDQITYSMIKK